MNDIRAAPSSHCLKTCIQIFTKKTLRSTEFTRRTDGLHTDAPAIFVYVRSRGATRRKKRNETNRIESQLSEALAAKRRLNARDSYDADDAALAPRVGRLSSLSLSLAKQSGDERWWKPVRKFAAKLAPVDAAILEIETLAKRCCPGVKLSRGSRKEREP